MNSIDTILNEEKFTHKIQTPKKITYSVPELEKDAGHALPAGKVKILLQENPVT